MGCSGTRSTFTATTAVNVEPVATKARRGVRSLSPQDHELAVGDLEADVVHRARAVAVLLAQAGQADGADVLLLGVIGSS